ncbi:4-hydroxybutyrate coenzyme A transferase [Clostridium sp. CAG:678]|uniref:4-hydroxybutyrate CoA-transferase n=1 Tax=Candidatus Eubacterium faecale TaxID=2838568 RepID=A0A9D2MII0_9FIRM|nr:4-hydroxybutyrate coenzyme A transferase [Clostridium sp. CAG:678]HJB75426.1 4-hydroxybutyrate CoA-transferase [Candidatus Eubacterium faecale]
MDNKELYQSKVITAEDAAGLIKDGDKVVTAFGCCEPLGIERAIEKNYLNYKNVEIINMLIIGDTPWVRDEMKGHIKYNSFFASASNRKAISSGIADFTTCHFYEIPMVLKEIIKPRVGLYSVCPPDEDGYVSLGTNIDYIEPTMSHCELKIAQVNKYVPRSYGKARKHISEFDYFVECDHPLPEVPSVELTDVEKAIGRNCASLIHDGDCLQLGIGGIPNAICEELKSKKDLGLHSEMVGDGVVDLLKSGVINNSKKQTHKGKTILGFAFGTTKLFDYMNNNKDIEMYPIDYVNYPPNIAKNDNVVSINSCIQIDLMGQVVADTIGLTQFSGVGGQVDFVRGATMSKGGRSIIAMPSTAKHDTISKIVPTITENSAVTTTRNDVNCVVTEYGIAYLKGRTLKERARALIKVAHPNFRDWLSEEFEKRFHEKAFD